MENLNKQKRKLDYKWVVIASCFLMVFTCLGFCSSTKSLFIGPITENLGVERSIYSFNDSLRFIATAVVNLFFGSLVMKFGPRKLIAAGFVSLILSMLCYALAPNVLVLYLGGILLGVGLSWTTTTMVGYVVNIWSKENKGTIMGAVLAANGLGGAVAIQIISPIIEKAGERPGYKNAYLLIAAILFCVGALIVSLIRNKPKDMDDSEITVSHKKRRGQSWVGAEYTEITKTWFFWGALICIFFTGFVLHAINGVAVQHMKDVGLDAAYVATVWSCHSLALAGFKFLTGFIYDKFGLRITANICSITAIFVMIALALITPTPMGKVLALTYALFSSLALPLETIMLPIYANDLFGEKAFKKTLGIFVSVNTAGYALAPPLMNLCYDLLGSYKVGLIISGGIMLAIVVALQFVISSANRMKKQIIISSTEE